MFVRAPFRPFLARRPPPFDLHLFTSTRSRRWTSSIFRCCSATSTRPALASSSSRRTPTPSMGCNSVLPWLCWETVLFCSLVLVVFLFVCLFALVFLQMQPFYRQLNCSARLKNSWSFYTRAFTGRFVLTSCPLSKCSLRRCALLFS